MIKIANEKKRDASLHLEPKPKKTTIEFVMPDGTRVTNVKILKTTLEKDLSSLIDQYQSLENLAQAIIEADPEIDLERTGMILGPSKKLFVSKDNKILYGVDIYEIVRNPDGSEKERHLYQKTQANIHSEMPLLWSGKFFPKSEAIRMFVFSRKYQIRHVNGLTYDFLYDMAKKLHEKNAMMLIGSGKKGLEPLIFHDGGIPYRGFLEGRIKDQTYCLILHLTNLELKALVSDQG